MHTHENMTDELALQIRMWIKERKKSTFGREAGQ